MRELTHFIAGRPVRGASGRFGDVFDPSTGEVQAKAPLASRAEVRAAIEAAAKAFPDWSAQNPQKRARVMFAFKALVEREMDALARMLSAEHGKVLADSRGDIQRGLEVIEFACGIPHLTKGEFTENAGTGIDVYSMRQPLGVVAGITPFNFPAMIPMWMFGVAIACGNTFVCKPSEKDPSVPLRLAELMLEAGAPPGVLNVVIGDKEAVDAILEDPDVKAVSFVGSTAIADYVYRTGTANGKRVQAMGGAKNHAIVMPDADLDQVVDDLIGAGYGSAGERCMAISVAVPVGAKTADALVARLKPRVEALKVGLPTDPDANYGPLVTAEHRAKVMGYIEMARAKAPTSSSTAAASACRATRTASIWAARSSTACAPACGPTRRRSSAPSSRSRARTRSRRPPRCRRTILTATASRSSPATATPRGNSPRRCRSAWSASTCRSPCRSPITPSAAGSARPSAT